MSRSFLGHYTGNFFFFNPPAYVLYGPEWIEIPLGQNPAPSQKTGAGHFSLEHALASKYAMVCFAFFFSPALQYSVPTGICDFSVSDCFRNPQAVLAKRHYATEEDPIADRRL